VLKINKTNIPLGYETNFGRWLDPRMAGNNGNTLREVVAKAWALVEEEGMTGQPQAVSERPVERRLDTTLGPAAASLS
jgi:hypothetical protein